LSTRGLSCAAPAATLAVVAGLSAGALAQPPAPAKRCLRDQGIAGIVDPADEVGVATLTLRRRACIDGKRVTEPTPIETVTRLTATGRERGWRVVAVGAERSRYQRWKGRDHGLLRSSVRARFRGPEALPRVVVRLTVDLYADGVKVVIPTIATETEPPVPAA
jgi:hypothetical protein